MAGTYAVENPTANDGSQGVAHRPDKKHGPNIAQCASSLVGQGGQCWACDAKPESQADKKKVVANGVTCSYRIRHVAEKHFHPSVSLRSDIPRRLGDTHFLRDLPQQYCVNRRSKEQDPPNSLLIHRSRINSSMGLLGT